MSRDLPSNPNDLASDPASDLPELSLRSSLDLIAAAPFLIGYVPDRQLLIVCVDAASDLVRVAVSVELPSPGGGPARAAGIAESLRAYLAGTPFDAAYMLAFGDGPTATPVVDAVRAMLAERGVCTRRALRVHDGRYWTYSGTGDDSEACPPDGLPADLARSHIPAEAAVVGQAPFASRAAIADSIAPATGERREAMRTATTIAENLATTTNVADLAVLAACELPGLADHGDPCEAVIRALPQAADLYANRGVLGDVEAALLALAVRDLRRRDRAIELAMHGDSRAYVAVWSDLARRVEPGYRAPVLTVLAFAAWRDGGGALPVIATDQALRVEPGYYLARLMRELLNNGVNRSTFDYSEPDEPAESQSEQ